MPSMRSTVTITASAHVVPGPVTIGIRAAQGEWWCECHGWHRHDGDQALTCPAERVA